MSAADAVRPHRRGRRALLPLLPLLSAALLASCGGADAPPAQAGAARPLAGDVPAVPPAGSATTDAAATGGARAPAADACPMTGLWHSCSVQERLERAGFVLVPVRDSVGQRGLDIPGAAYRIGSAELQLYLYADSVDAIAQAARLNRDDAEAASVQGILRPPALIRSNNLVALLFGNNDRQRERVQLALTAGLPAG